MGYYVRRFYHLSMIKLSQFRQKLLIRRLRRLGKKRNLPSLDPWTDEQIIEGFRQMQKENHAGTN